MTAPDAARPQPNAADSGAAADAGGSKPAATAPQQISCTRTFKPRPVDELSYANILITGVAGGAFAGRFKGVVDFGQGEVESPTDAGFLLRLDEQCRTRWVKPYISSQYASANAVAVDRDGNVIVAGWFSGEIDIVSQPPTDGEQQLFLSKLSADGEPIWTKAFATGGQSGSFASEFRSIHTDAAGNIHVAGDVVTLTDFGSGPLQPGGMSTLLTFAMASFSPAGTFIAARSGPGLDDTHSCVGSAGQTTVAGEIARVDDSYAVKWPEISVQSRAPSINLVAQLAPDGMLAWSRVKDRMSLDTLSITTPKIGSAIACVNEDVMYLATDDDAALVTHLELVRYSATGEPLRRSEILAGPGARVVGPGQTPPYLGRALAVTSDARAFIASSFNSDIQITGQTLPQTKGGIDLAVITVDAQGQVTSSITWGSAEDDHSAVIAVDSNDQIWIGGQSGYDSSEDFSAFILHL